MSWFPRRDLPGLRSEGGGERGHVRWRLGGVGGRQWGCKVNKLINGKKN